MLRSTQVRSLHASSKSSLKVLCALYEDPTKGYPKSLKDYARDSVPVLPPKYPDGQLLPTPKAIDFTPGQLLGSVSGELGLRKFLESRGHKLVVTSDKDGPDSKFEKELVDADIVISQPYVAAVDVIDLIPLN